MCCHQAVSFVLMAVGKKAVEFFEKRDYDLVWKYPQIAESIDTDTVFEGIIMASAPAHSQVRAMAPKLRTSVIPSSMTN